MRKSEVQIGGVYRAKVSGKVVRIRITGESLYGGWDAKNLETGRMIRIRGFQRIRGFWSGSRDWLDDQIWAADDGSRFPGHVMAIRLQDSGVAPSAEAAIQLMKASTIGGVIKTGVSGYTRLQ